MFIKKSLKLLKDIVNGKIKLDEFDYEIVNINTKKKERF